MLFFVFVEVSTFFRSFDINRFRIVFVVCMCDDDVFMLFLLFGVVDVSGFECLFVLCVVSVVLFDILYFNMCSFMCC